MTGPVQSRFRRVSESLTCDDDQVFVSLGETDVTFREMPRNIMSVRYWTEQMLTKRRAVDYCRVSTALCRTA